MKYVKSNLLFLVTGILTGFALSFFRPINAKANNLVFDSVAARSFQLVDSGGRRLIEISSTGDKAPAIWFFDADGKVRLNLGLYPEGDAFIVLNDSNEKAVQIFRTFGPRHSPVLVMKSEGKDRIVFGLNPETQEPMLILYDEQGTKRSIFGAY